MAETALAKSKEGTAAETKWYVQDNCFPKDKQADPKFKRNHDLDGINYTFSYGQKLQVPVRHAMKFAQVPGFVVWDENKKKIEPLRTHAGDGAIAGLKPHETVATYAELSTEALVARCRRLPNGAAFHSKSPKPVMIDFLMSGGLPPIQKVEEGPDDLDATEGSEDGVDTLDDGGTDDGDASLADGIFQANQ
jgi:hypothetical protein